MPRKSKTTEPEFNPEFLELKFDKAELYHHGKKFKFNSVTIRLDAISSMCYNFLNEDTDNCTADVHFFMKDGSLIICRFDVCEFGTVFNDFMRDNYIWDMRESIGVYQVIENINKSHSEKS